MSYRWPSSNAMALNGMRFCDFDNRVGVVSETVGT
jgi:hypothetical protein